MCAFFSHSNRRRFFSTLTAVSATSVLRAAETVSTNAVASTNKPAATAPKIANLNELLEPIRAKGRVPSLATAVIVDEKLSGVGAVGIRKGGSPIPVKGTDLWHIGSCTKAMTATLIAVFVERRKMQWDMTIV